MKLAQLREKVIFHTEEARKIKNKAEEEDRTMTEEEVLAFDKNMKEADRYEAEADRQERLEEKEASLADAKKRKVNPQINTGERIEHTPSERMFRYGKLRSFTGPEAERNAYRAGKWLLATVMDDAAARRWRR
jgi:hypothetical protein